MKSKSELKKEYKQFKADMGVFQIVNKCNGKRLIDNSLDMKSKWNRHLTELNFGNHKNSSLQNDWNELGKECFFFEVISNLKYQENGNVNHSQELKVLHEMVLEELESDSSSLY